MRELSNPTEVEEALGELEALFFAASQALTIAQIGRRLYLSDDHARALLASYRLRLDEPSRGLQLRDAGAGWKLETKPRHNDVIAAERAARREKPLTAQALETLAVIALAQPIGTQEVSRTRGTESYAAIETLRRHGLVAPVENPGDRGNPGKATRWRTTQRLLDRLGLKSLAELAQKGAQQTLLSDRSIGRRLAAQPPGTESDSLPSEHANLVE
jgi:segregation and condensation protein B